MNDFYGKKFFCSGTTIVYDEFGTMQEKAEFRMTRSYLKYLREKEQKQLELEVLALKSKLEYQYKTYGSVDDLDYKNFLKLYNKLKER